MKNEQKNKRNYDALLFIIWALCLIVTCGDLLFNHCERSKTSPPTENTDLQTHNNVIKRRIIGRVHKVDQVKQIIPKAQKSAQVYYDTIIVYAPDTCLSYLSNYKAYRDSTEKLLLYVVASQDSTILSQDTIIRNDSIMLVRAYKTVEDTVKYYKKAVRKRGFKRLVQGGVFVAIVVAVTNVINQIKK